jgi:hypothetical protein
VGHRPDTRGVGNKHVLVEQEWLTGDRALSKLLPTLVVRVALGACCRPF